MLLPAAVSSCLIDGEMLSMHPRVAAILPVVHQTTRRLEWAPMPQSGAALSYPSEMNVSCRPQFLRPRTCCASSSFGQRTTSALPLGHAQPHSRSRLFCNV